MKKIIIYLLIYNINLNYIFCNNSKELILWCFKNQDNLFKNDQKNIIISIINNTFKKFEKDKNLIFKQACDIKSNNNLSIIFYEDVEFFYSKYNYNNSTIIFNYKYFKKISVKKRKLSKVMLNEIKQIFKKNIKKKQKLYYYKIFKLKKYEKIIQ